MKKIILNLTTFLFVICSSVVVCEEMKPIEVKDYSNSVYFICSDGQLYHSDDFGLSFDKVEGVKYPKLKVNQLNKSVDNSKLSLDGQKLKYNIDENVDGIIKVETSDLIGNSEIFQLNSTQSNKGYINLRKQYKLLIVKLRYQNNEERVFKLLN